MSQVYLEIDSLDTLIAFLAEAKKKGLLKNVSVEQIETLFRGKAFPIRLPVNLSEILAIGENAVIRKTFGKRIETKTVDILNQALRLG